jgi:FtsZ-binding cell division protein ZapB
MAKNRVVFTVTLGELAEVPGTPFAYWAPKSLRDLFQKFPPLDRDVARMPDKPKIADVKQGLATADDLRFTRFWWEVPVEKIGTSNEETFQGKKWVPFENDVFLFYFCGGLTTVVNWEKGGEEIKAYRDANGRQLSRPQNESFYFRAGLAWSVGLQRSQLKKALKLQRMPFRILPKGCIFGVAAQGVLANEADTWWLLAILTSRALFFASRCMGVDKMPGTSYCAELSIALPNEEQRLILTALSREAHDRLREWATGDETATVFAAPWILQVYDAVKSGTLGMPKTGHPLSRDFEWRYGIPEPALEHAQNALQNRFSLYALAEACVIWEAELRRRIDEIQRQIDYEVFWLYEISDEDRAIIEAEMAKPIETEELEGEETEAEGEPEEEIQLEGVLTAEEHIKRLIHYLAHQVIREDPDGIVPLQDCYPAGRSELELGLVSRVRKKLQEIFGEGAMPTVERELQQALGSRLEDWLAREFFGYHVGLYRLRPIIWQITLPSSPESQRNQRSRRRSATQTVQTDFSVFIYWHKLDSDTLRKVRHIYLQPFLDAVEKEIQRGIERVTSGDLTVSQLKDEAQRLSQAQSRLEALKNLAQRIDELLQPHTLQVESRSEWVKEKVNEIVANGYNPNLDYGVRVNIEPLKQKGILPRDAERVRG